MKEEIEKQRAIISELRDSGRCTEETCRDAMELAKSMEAKLHSAEVPPSAQSGLLEVKPCDFSITNAGFFFLLVWKF